MAFSFLKRKKETALKNQLEFCMTNLSLGSADAYDVLAEREDVDIIESGWIMHFSMSLARMRLPQGKPRRRRALKSSLLWRANGICRYSSTPAMLPEIRWRL